MSSLYYSLSSAYTASTMQVRRQTASSLGTGIGATNTNLRLVSGNHDGLQFPIVFNQVSGSRLTDILDSSSASLLIISTRFVEVLQQHRFSGYKTFAVKIQDKNEKEIQGYHGLSITGRAGKIDYRKSQVIEKQAVPNGPLTKYLKGLHIDMDRWDRSDFFLPEDNFTTIVTEGVMNALKAAKLSNVRLGSLTDFEIQAFAVPK